MSIQTAGVQTAALNVSAETAAPAPRRILPFAAPITDALSPFAEPLLRVVVGLTLVPHGAQKLFGAFGGYGLEATGQFFEAKLGLPPVMALIAGLIEFFGGLALAAGLLTRPVAALAAGLLAVAAFQVHWGAGFFWTAGGFEYPLLWAVAALYFALRGGGRYSADAAIGREF